MIKIRICGFGGQGILLAGEILGTAAMIEGKYSSEMGSYGAEARGTTTVSDVIISDRKISFPVIDECDILVAMSQQAFNANAKFVKRDGIIIIDEDLVKIPENLTQKVFKVRATKIAEEKFGRLAANMIILGYLAGKTKIVSTESLKKAVKSRVTRMVEANLAAIDEGAKLAHEGGV
jgi:2-oxoglutarate ferredoxin oxidoreductase subunit gamma